MSNFLQMYVVTDVMWNPDDESPSASETSQALGDCSYQYNFRFCKGLRRLASPQTWTSQEFFHSSQSLGILEYLANETR